MAKITTTVSNLDKAEKLNMTDNIVINKYLYSWRSTLSSLIEITRIAINMNLDVNIIEVIKSLRTELSMKSKEMTKAYNEFNKTVSAELIETERRIYNITNSLDNYDNTQNVKVLYHNVSPRLVEIGHKNVPIEVKWGLSEPPKKQKIKNQILDTNARSFSFIMQDMLPESFELVVEDYNGTVTSKTLEIILANNIYYGVSYNHNPSFTRNLHKKLSDNKKHKLELYAGENEYVYFVCPNRFGTCFFDIRCYTDCVIERVSTETLYNDYNYGELYDIYRTNISGVGSIEIEVR